MSTTIVHLLQPFCHSTCYFFANNQFNPSFHSFMPAFSFLQLCVSATQQPIPFFVFTTIATHPIVFRQPFLSIYLTVVFNQPSFNPILLPYLLCFFLHHSACLQPTYVLTSNQFRQPFRFFLRPSASTDCMVTPTIDHPAPPLSSYPPSPSSPTTLSCIWSKASVLCSPPLPPTV